MSPSPTDAMWVLLLVPPISFLPLRSLLPPLLHHVNLVSVSSDHAFISYWSLRPHHPLSTLLSSQTIPLHATRGPGFSLDDFRPLPPSFEPSEEELLCSVSGALAASHCLLNKEWSEVCFAGWGEPTLRWATVLAVAEGLRKGNRARGRGGGSEGGGGGEGLRLRLNTNGLGNVAQQRKIVSELAEAFESVTGKKGGRDGGRGRGQWTLSDVVPRFGGCFLVALLCC